MGRKGKIPKGEQYLPQVSLDELTKLYRKEKDGKAKLRLLAYIHRKKGRTQQEIAELLFHPLMTVHDWLDRGQKSGITLVETISVTMFFDFCE